MKPHYDPNDPRTWTRAQREAYLRAPITMQHVKGRTHAGAGLQDEDDSTRIPLDNTGTFRVMKHPGAE